MSQIKEDWENAEYIVSKDGTSITATVPRSEFHPTDEAVVKGSIETFGYYTDLDPETYTEPIVRLTDLETGDTFTTNPSALLREMHADILRKGGSIQILDHTDADTFHLEIRIGDETGTWQAVYDLN